MRRCLLAIAGVLAAVGVADAASGVSLVQAARSGDAKAVHRTPRKRLEHEDAQASVEQGNSRISHAASPLAALRETMASFP